MRRRAGWLVALAVAAACGRGPVEPHGLRDVRAVLRLPGDSPYRMTSAPDGTLFFSTIGGLLSRSRDTARTWEHIATPGIRVHLYAPSRSTLFAAGSGEPEVFRWDEGRGLRAERTPVSGVHRMCGHYGATIVFGAVWGRGAREVYAVGTDGVVLRFDGARWAVEPNPLGGAEPDPCAGSANAVRGVGGDARYLYAAGSRIMRRSPNGRWDLLAIPSRPGELGYVQGIVSGGAGPLFIASVSRRGAGTAPHPLHVFRPAPRSGGWESVWRGGPFIEFPIAGHSAPASAPVFFGMGTPHLFAVTGDRVRHFRVPGLPDIRGASAVGRTVVVAGRRDTIGWVMRGRLP